MWRECGPLSLPLRSVRRGVHKVAPHCVRVTSPAAASSYVLDCGRLVSSTPRTSRLSTTLAGGDARAILAQLVQLMACNGSPSELYGTNSRIGRAIERVDVLPLNIFTQPAENAGTVLQLLAACVAGCTPSMYWPCWVRARLRPCVAEYAAGCSAASLSTSPQRRPVGAKDDDEHAVALSALTFVTMKLNSAVGVDDKTASVVLRELRFVALLCAISIAPSLEAAIQLAKHAARTSNEAAGVALATYLRNFLSNTHPVAATGDEATEEQAYPTIATDVEARWLSSWNHIRTERSAPNAARYDCTDGVCSLAALDWHALQREHIHWWLHCLLSQERYVEAKMLVQSPLNLRGTTGRGGTLASLRSDTRVALLTHLPLRLLHATPDLYDGLVSSLLADTAADSLNGGGVETCTTRRGKRVALVTTDARLFARLLERLVIRCQDAPDEGHFCRELSSIRALLSLARADPLVASFVPPHETLAAVMVARPSSFRRTRLRELVAGLRYCISMLCDENGGGKLRDREDETETMNRHTSNNILCPTSHAQWRRRAAGVAGEIIALATRLLCCIVFLSAAREGSLPQRTAEPLWRRRLKQRSAVRIHKYHLLLSELPHDFLSDIVRMLITCGYLHEACDLGCCLAKYERIDLMAYPLPILGALYQTVLWASKWRQVENCSDFAAGMQARGLIHSSHDNCTVIIHPSNHVSAIEKDMDVECTPATLLQQLHALYMRRQEVFGETTIVTPNSPVTVKVDHALKSVLSNGTQSAKTAMDVDGSTTSLQTLIGHSLRQQLCRICIAPGGVPILDCRQPLLFAHWRIEGHVIASTRH